MLSYMCDISSNDYYNEMEYRMNTEADVRYTEAFLAIFKYYSDKVNTSAETYQQCVTDMERLWLEYQMQVSEYIHYMMRPLSTCEHCEEKLYELGLIDGGGYWLDYNGVSPLVSDHYFVEDGVIHYILAIRPHSEEYVELLTIAGEVNKEGVGLSTITALHSVEFLTMPMMKNAKEYKVLFEKEIQQFIHRSEVYHSEIELSFE